MTLALLLAETILLVIAGVFITGLLRSHAEILRRVSALEGSGAGAAPTPGMLALTGEAGIDLAGQTIAGDSVELAIAGGGQSVLLAFLSTGCGACVPLWESLRAGIEVPGHARLVLVTKGPDEESPARLHAIAPQRYELVMSTQAWRDYSVPGSPHFVMIDGPSGTIAGRGAASSWEQIAALLSDAAGDAQAFSSRSSHSTDTATRAQRAEQALRRSGVGPGHPSLYPSSGPAAESS